MFRFEHSEILWWLLVIPALFILFTIVKIWRKKALKRFAESPLLDTVIPDLSKGKHNFKFILYALALICLILGLANPQFGSKMEEVKREGVDIMVAVDVSNSMMTEDIRPNRLERTQRAIEKLIGNLKNDRIGLIVFAGQAYIQLPITSDYAAAKLFTSTIETSIVPIQGTAIGAAIEEGTKALSNDESRSKAMIVITDGENHEDNAVEAASKAKELGIFVHTVGMGSVQGGPIPSYRNGRKNGFKTDNGGNTVVSRLNENMLREISTAGGGVYVRATNSNSGLESILSEINKMEKQEYESKLYTDFEDRYQPLLLASLVLLIIDFFIGWGKNKWGRNLNLFDS